MQILVKQQLHDYLSDILIKVCTEKNENINVIDNLIANQNIKIDNQKQCYKCGKNEIENSKCKCLQCKTKLLILTEI